VNPGRFETLLETLAGIAAAQVVVIETLHEHRLLDKRHFAHAFGRALDALAPELRGGMVENVLRDMRDRCLNLPGDGNPEVRAWLRALARETKVSR
jgi:hypothetical protein